MAPSPDAIIQRLAARQRAMVARWQLLHAGVSGGAIDHRLAVGRLTTEFPGVYLAGPVVPPLGREVAVVLACGRGTALAGHSSLWIWEVADEPDLVHVARTSGSGGRRLPGVRLHRVQALEVRRRKGLPVMSPAQAIRSVAGELTPEALERVVAEGIAKRLIREEDVAPVPGQRGAANLRQILDEGPAYTRSRAERILLALVRKGGLTRFVANVEVAGRERDFVWARERVVVEVDGYEVHKSRTAFERDRARDQELVSLGWRVLRVTWRQLTREPELVLARLAAALAIAAAA